MVTAQDYVTAKMQRSNRPPLGTAYSIIRNSIFKFDGSVWGADMSGPQRRFSGEPTCRLSGPQRRYAGEPTGLLPNARQPTCRLPNDNLLGSRQVCSRTPDSRPVGALTLICWGADMSGLQWPPMFDWL